MGNDHLHNGELIATLREALASEADLELAVLVGSQADGNASSNSDFDIAIRWLPGKDLLEQVGRTEELRRRLSTILGVSESRIDLIDIPTARLAMRSVIAEEGVPLKGDDGIAWMHFLTRTWRELEEFYWESIYA